MLKDRFLQEIGIFLKLKDEREEITELEMINDDPVTFKFTLCIKNNNYHFELLLCSYFPFQPIIIKSLDTNWRSKHQYKDGSMCLKWGVDNWNEELSIKDLVMNLIELIDVENPLGDEHGIAEDGDSFTVGQQLDRSMGTYTLFYEDCEIENLPLKGNGVLQILGANKKAICFIEKIGENIIRDNLINQKAKRIKFNYRKIKENFSNEKFNVLRKKSRLNSINIYIFNDKILGLEKVCLKSEDDLEKYNKKRPFKVSFVDSEGKKIESYPDNFFPIYWNNPIEALNITSEKEKRIPLSKEVKEKNIAILGLGSIGSRVLIDLSRAGFENFLLVDGDIFMPYNVIRHELFNKFIGFPKVKALSNFIKEEINDKIRIESFYFAVNGQQSSTGVHELLECLSHSDIIVDCTADSNLIFGINEVVMKNDINYISGSVISGGIGNILTKRCKGSNLSVIDLLESQKKFFQMNRIDNFLQNDYSATFGETQYVASMSDCSIIAGLVGKNVINMLQENDECAKSDIYIMSTSNNFIGPAYSVYSALGHKTEYDPPKLDEKLVERGRDYYNNYTERNKNNNS
ncbi:MAG TPA: hypothetical protein GX708_18835 [Gallicola sp.]|nr:hypothetical protein [Gallicola sp.]